MQKTDHTLIFFKTASEALQPFVRRFLVVESTQTHADSHLPDTGFVAAFRFRGDCQLDGGSPAATASITGLWHRTRRHTHSHDHAVVIANFTAAGATAFLQQPLDAFANHTLALESVFGRPARFAQLYEQLAAANDHQQRIHLVEQLLSERIKDARLDPIITAATGLIERAQTKLSMSGLAQLVGLSQSALERRFRRQVGTSPHHFASLVRLQQVVRLQKTGADFTTIAHDAGYYDQSHLIKEFKQISGETPSSFFARTLAL